MVQKYSSKNWYKVDRWRRTYYIVVNIGSHRIMKIIRSTKCSLKFANPAKLNKLGDVLEEYGRVVNLFIGKFWADCPSKSQLLKPVVDSVLPSWLSARLRRQRGYKCRQEHSPAIPFRSLRCRMQASKWTFVHSLRNGK